jgi:hypothetical protein
VIISIIRRQTGYVASVGERCVLWFGGKPKGERSLGRPRNRWEDNINCILRNRMEGFRLDSPGSGQGLVVASHKHSYYIQGDSGGICTTLGNDSMSDSKQKRS